MGKKLVRLTESDLHNIIRSSVNKILFESPYKPNANKPKTYKQQVNHSGLMQKAVNNGGVSNEMNEYLSNSKSYYAAIAKLAMENNITYTDTLSDLQNKITYYLNYGYFGNNSEVTNTIKLFTELLSYLHGAYESAAKQVYANRVNEGVSDWFRGLADNFRYKDTNRFGIHQKIDDRSGNQYAVRQKNGQWMTDLQNELRQLLQWKFLHGKKTVNATEAFIKFLEVEKRGFGDFTLAWKNLRVMYISLIGLTLLLSSDEGNNNAMQPNQFGSQPTTQQTQQQSQSLNIGFEVNSPTINQDGLQKLQSLANVNAPITIVVHQSQNSSGKDASYEAHLYMQRAQAIMNMLGKQCKVVRGSNSQTPYAEVVVGQTPFQTANAGSFF
jgi:hypothetical protein